MLYILRKETTVLPVIDINSGSTTVAPCEKDNTIRWLMTSISVFLFFWTVYYFILLHFTLLMLYFSYYASYRRSGAFGLPLSLHLHSPAHIDDTAVFMEK